MSYINIAQIIVSVIIIALILMQERESGISGLFGGSGEMSGVYQARRGLEKILFIATIAAIVVFIALSVINLIKS